MEKNYQINKLQKRYPANHFCCCTSWADGKILWRIKDSIINLMSTYMGQLVTQ